MKKLILVVALALVSAVGFSQNPLTVGQSQLNVGVGLSDRGIPVYLGLDHGISRDLPLVVNCLTVHLTNMKEAVNMTTMLLEFQVI